MASRSLLIESDDRAGDASSRFSKLRNAPTQVQRRNDRSDSTASLSDSQLTHLKSSRGTGRYGYVAEDDSLQDVFVPSRTLKFVPVPSSAWRDTRAQIERWAALQPDWNGDDADPPTRAQIVAVRSFVSEAERRGVREPRPYIAADGEIGFHWDGERKASVSFLPQNRFLAFCPRGTGEPVRISGPLDIAACSREMFDALKASS